MPRYIALSSLRHAEHGWLANPDYTFAAERPLAELVAEEMPHALPTLPLAFLPEGGEWRLVSLLSLDARHNLFVHPDGRWLGGYIPAALRSYPFALLPVERSAKKALCFDEESGLLLEHAEGGQRFFTPEGELNGSTYQVMNFLQQLDQRRRTTRRAVTRLAEAELIVPWEISLDGEEGQRQAVEGLYRLDEAALRALPGEKLSQLADGGALSIAYAQLFSQHRLPGLSRLVALQKKLGEQQQSAVADVESLMNEGDDDLTFDFDS
ncbi:SapC family protein [Kushneria aurantia]|uniref:SapC family protein n=1 Tax=Kushneria aurantia TaxID=504092 RepID=A0ABV6FZ49_9GAMM|nr:SapC family protein [Kushneria aurantia]